MESPRSKEESIFKVVRNLFRLEKIKTETINTPTRDIKNTFRLNKLKEINIGN